MRTVINIPVGLIRDHKDSRRRMELLSFAVAIKMAYSNSCLTDVHPAKVRRLMHCSHPKAVQLISDAKESPLFTVYGKAGNLRVNSFRDKTEKTACNGRKYTSDWCYKLEIKDYSLRELVASMREILLENVIYAKERQVNNASSEGCATPVAVTQSNLANAAGVSRSSVQNILKAMKQKGKDPVASKSRIVRVLDHVNDSTAGEFLKSTHRRGIITYCMVGFLMMPCLYSILGSGESARFQHVIHNYRKSALNSNPNPEKGQNNAFDVFSSHLMDAYN